MTHRLIAKVIKVQASGFFARKPFSTYFHVKTPNKHPYNLNKQISQIKTLLNYSKSTRSNWIKKKHISPS
jgi:hypothetical protein